MNDLYKDIIELPHHVSKRHPQMSMYNRAAQFASFAALTGHDAAVKETARLTDCEFELSESDADVLNRKLDYILKNINECIPVEIVYFEADNKKDGGYYKTKAGVVKKADLVTGVLELNDGSRILIQHIKNLKVSGVKH